MSEDTVVINNNSIQAIEQATTDEMLSATIEPLGVFVGVPEVACEPNCEPNCEFEQKMECGEEIPNGCS